MIGAATLLAFLGQQVMAKGQGLLDFTLFRSDDFSFAFIVSFVAGAALFGSAFLIPSFAVSVLAFTPTDAGLLLLPSGALFIGALLMAAFLMQVRGVPPFATVPFGILMIMVAMWMLSGSTSESGADDMMAAILLRGLGLGFLFLSITLIAFSNLNSRNLASGIGLFNTGRQLGGLMGVAGLQTLIDHNVAANVAVLGANVTAGVPAVSERLTTTTAMLAARGMDAVAASRAATSLLGRVVTGQSTVIAFDTAFNAVALLFVSRRARAGRHQDRTLPIRENAVSRPDRSSHRTRGRNVESTRSKNSGPGLPDCILTDDRTCRSAGDATAARSQSDRSAGPRPAMRVRHHPSDTVSRAPPTFLTAKGSWRTRSMSARRPTCKLVICRAAEAIVAVELWQISSLKAAPNGVFCDPWTTLGRKCATDTAPGFAWPWFRPD